MDIEKLKFPIGKFIKPEIITNEIRESYLLDLEVLPSQIKKETDGLSKEEMQKCYRPNGWNIIQLVHHLADSHLNCLIRLKWALTEENPTIKPYNQNEWAKLADANVFPINDSLSILEGVHNKLLVLLNSLSKNDLNKTYVHPEYNVTRNIDETIGLYAWHGKHHLEHIKIAKGN